MASSAFIKTQLAHSRDPLKIPQASATDPYTAPQHSWDTHTQAMYDHFRPVVAQSPLAPLGAVAAQSLEEQVQRQNPYFQQYQPQQQHPASTSASVSTINHGMTSDVNMMPSRANAVGVATLPPSATLPNNNRFVTSDITQATQNKANTSALVGGGMGGKIGLQQPSHQQNFGNSNVSLSAIPSATSTSQSSSPAANAAVQHLLNQIQFLHKEVERLESELSTTRQEHAESMRRMFERGIKGSTAGSLNASELNVSGTADGSSAAAAAILGPAAASRRLHEHQLQLAASEAQQLQQRCRNLESQLAAANAAKTVALNEKLELNTKFKKLEATLKLKQQSLASAEENMSAQTASSGDEVQKLKQRLEDTLKEFRKVAKELDRANDDLAQMHQERQDRKNRLVSSFVQCGGDPSEDANDPNSLFTFRRLHNMGTVTDKLEKMDAGCQVDTTMSHNADSELLFMAGMSGGLGVGADIPQNQVQRRPGDTSAHFSELSSIHTMNLSPTAASTAVGALNYNNMAHMLQVRCAELDTARSDLHRLTELHKETLQFLDMTKKRLNSELEHRKLVENDNEKLALQVRALQQQASLMASQLREKDTLMENLQKETQEAISTALRMEKERARWEEELSTNAKDMQNLVTNQNFVHQQMSAVNSENDELRREVQRLLQLESTNQMAYRAKESELAEVLQAYQLAVKESEANVIHFKALERESENLRASLSVKEERVVHLQEQVASLHAREQQLTLDLQSFDYEGGQLHRRLITSETTIAQLNAQIHELQQVQVASQRIHHELEASQAELSKQIVFRDQECMHLRMRCDQLEQECTALSTARLAEVSRLKELEDQNARQQVREALFKQSASDAYEQQVNRLTKELNDARAALRERETTLVNQRLASDSDRSLAEAYVVRVKELEQGVAVAEAERARLQKIVEEQAETLAKLAM